MASQKQIDANRKNAQNSCGPKTEAPKEKSRRNAIRDSLTGQVTTLSNEDRAIFEQFRAEILADFKPQTAMERNLAQSIAWDNWRLDRLRAIEMNVFALGEEEAMQADESEGTARPDDYQIALSDARTFRSEAGRFERMSLYEQRMNRNLHRNLATLRDLQAERKRNYEHDKNEEVKLARLYEFNDMPIQASKMPSKNEFVFSNEEIAVAAVQHRHAATAAYFLKNTKPTNMFGTLSLGCRDSLLEKVADQRPLSVEEWHSIDSVHPEERAVHRLNHPEEYGVRASKPVPLQV